MARKKKLMTEAKKRVALRELRKWEKSIATKADCRKLENRVRKLEAAIRRLQKCPVVRLVKAKGK
jgi:transcription initiation factor TFIIIB Brf1 subunit/transcription initiation factor TFIIB